MDQREWDYGTRMSRSRRAAGSWSTREPEVENPEPRWASLTDTGSMAPSDEALTWQRRADDWAHQAEVEPYNGGGQAIEPVNRWSTEVNAAGRPTFPADGVGWRTETAEWRATGGRWRQTTEWRSATGSHVWRSTTEAWEGDEDTPKGEKPAITGTAWPTPGSESDGPASATPSWRKSPAAWEQPISATEQQTPSWRQTDPAPTSWQSTEPTPSWRQSEPAPSWQQSEPPAARQQPPPSWRQDEPSTSWRQTEPPAARQQPDPVPSWRQDEPAPSWRQAEPETPSWRRTDPDNSSSWRRTDPDNSSSWRRGTEGRSATTPVEQTRSAGASWQLPSSQTPSWQQQPPPAQPPSWQQPSTRTPSWQEPSGPSQTPSWQQPSTQTPSWQLPSAQTPSREQPSWQEPQQPTGPTSRRRAEDTGSWSSTASAGGTWSDRPSPGENTGGITRWDRADTPGWQRSPVEDAQHLVREDDRAAWRREAAYSDRPTRAGRRRAAEVDPAPAGGTGWSTAADADNWAGHEDTGNITAFSDPGNAAEPGNWGARPETPSRRDRRRYAEESRPEPDRPDPASPDQTGRRGRRPSSGQGRPRYNANPTNWREDTSSWDAEQDTSNWKRDPDTGQWSRSEDDPRVLAWRAEAARREAMREAQPEETTGRRARRDETAGGVPGGPLPSSSVPADGGSGWSNGGTMPSARPRSAMPENTPPGGMPLGPRPRSAMPDSTSPREATPGVRPRSAMPESTQFGFTPGVRPRSSMPQGMSSGGSAPGSRPRSALPGPVGPVDDGPGRRRRGEDPYRADDFGPGRRRAPGSGAESADEPLSRETWQLPPESRRNRRSGVEPDDHLTEGGRPGPRPPQWQDPAARDRRRADYRDEPPFDGPSRPDPSDYGDSSGQWQAQPAPRSGFGSASRALPAGPSTPQQRSPYGGPQRELPAGPSAQPQRSPYGGPQRELPAGPSAYATPPAEPSPSGQSWLEQERRQAPQRSAAEPSWIEQERQQQAPQRPGYETPDTRPSWLEQERQQQTPERPGYGAPGTEPSWLDQERQQAAQRPGYDSPADGPSWRDQERSQSPQGPSYGAARADGEAPGGTRWPEQRKPGYGTSDELTARWPDPLADQSGRRGHDDRDDPPPPAGGGFGDRPPLADWLAAERAGRRGADYRGGAGQDGETDWRRELSQNGLADGESRRYDTSDFPPFRPSGTATVAGASNLALSATSVISTAPSAGSGTATALAPPRPDADEDTSWPPRRSTGAFQGTGSYERRPVTGGILAGQPSDLLDPDDDEEQEQAVSPLAVIGYTVVWYGVPVVLFVLGIFFLNAGQRAQALSTLAGAAPQFGISLALSMLVAFGLRTATTAWKPASVGLAAAVVGGGLATVLSSAITGNSLS